MGSQWQLSRGDIFVRGVRGREEAVWDWRLAAVGRQDPQCGASYRGGGGLVGGALRWGQGLDCWRES